MEEQIKQLSKYLKDQIALGVSEDTLKQASLSQGWDEANFTKALTMAKFNVPLPPTPASPVAPALSLVPPPATSSSTVAPAFDMNTIMKNDKLVSTIKTFLIFSPIIMAVNGLIGILNHNFSIMSAYGMLKYINYSKLFFSGVNSGIVINWVLMGLIYGLIGGFLFYFIYNPIKNWVKTIEVLQPFIRDMFSMMWIPTLFFTLIGFAFSLLDLLNHTFNSGRLLSIVIPPIAQLAVSFFYSKLVSQKLQQYYPW